MSIFLSDWRRCATITTSYTNDNYVQLLNCPQDAGLTWKIEDDNGICAQTQADWVDWERPDDNAQKTLGYYLDTESERGWITTATSGPNTGNCGIRSFSAFKDTTSVEAWQSTGSIIIYWKFVGIYEMAPLPQKVYGFF